MQIRETDVELQSGGDLCRAWLFVPSEMKTRAPCIVMGHGFGLTRRCGLRELAVPFAEAGYAVLAFDYRGFGDSGGAPRRLVSLRKQVDDWIAAIAFARAQPEVDSDRIVTWGFSLGAGHALTVAALDPQVAAAITVVPMFDGLSSTLAAVKQWSFVNALRMVWRGVRDLLRGSLGRPPVTVPCAAPSGELGLLTSPDAYPGYRAITPADFDYEMPARIGLLFWMYWPGLRLRRFTRALLVLPSRIDEINPPGPTLRRVKRCRSATVVELECEHIEAMMEPHRSRVIESTLEFLGERVAGPRV